MARWADISAAAEHLATTERHMRRLVHEREADGFPVHRLGGKVRFDLDELDAWVKSDALASSPRVVVGRVPEGRFGRRAS